jgi:LAGLIDADG DNA endonuclease family
MNFIEWMDGFLLGDGALALNKTGTKARAQIHVKHRSFAAYMMRGFRRYCPCEPRSYNQGRSWTAYTLQSGELYQQHRRWYPDGRKRIPSDLRLGRTSLLLWYLGDGMLSVREEKNSVEIRFANENFTQHELTHILLPQLEQLGVCAAITTERNIAVRIRSLRRFFALVGRTSPVACYWYKFAVPAWRFDTFSVKEAGEGLGVDWRWISQYVHRKRLSSIKPTGCRRRRLTHLGISKCRRLLATRVPKIQMRGERHPRAKLSTVQVSEIRDMRLAGATARRIVESLNLDVSMTQVYRVSTNRQRRTG